MPTFREGAAAAAPADTWALYFLFSRVTSSSTPLRVFVCSLFCFTRVSSSGLSCKVLVLLCSARPFHSPRLPSLVLPSSPASCLLSVVFCFPTETNIQSYLLICCLERRRKKKKRTNFVGYFFYHKSQCFLCVVLKGPVRNMLPLVLRVWKKLIGLSEKKCAFCFVTKWTWPVILFLISCDTWSTVGWGWKSQRFVGL